MSDYVLRWPLAYRPTSAARSPPKGRGEALDGQPGAPGVSVRPSCWDPRPSALAVRTHGGHTPGHLAYFRGRDGVLITCDPDQRQPSHHNRDVGGHPW